MQIARPHGEFHDPPAFIESRIDRLDGAPSACCSHELKLIIFSLYANLLRISSIYACMLILPIFSACDMRAF